MVIDTRGPIAVQLFVIAVCLLSSVTALQQDMEDAVIPEDMLKPRKPSPDIIIKDKLPVESASEKSITDEPTTSNKPKGVNGRAGIWPMVNVDRDANNSKVDVHVPIFFDMSKNDGKDKSKLDLSVLSGLVTVNRDKERAQNGDVSGPLTVTVFGIPVYSGRAVRSSQSRALDQIEEVTRAKQREMRETLENVKANVSNTFASIPAERIAENVRKINEDALHSISNMLKRMVARIEQHSELSSNKNGPPADVKDGFVKPSNFSRSDLEPKIPRILTDKGNKAHESNVYV